MTRELAEHWLVVRTDQENSGSVHSTGAGIDNLAGNVVSLLLSSPCHK